MYNVEVLGIMLYFIIIIMLKKEYHMSIVYVVAMMTYTFDNKVSI